MYWLAINREPVSFYQLQADLLANLSSGELLQAIASLQRRSLIEKNAVGLTQQPVVMEYVTNEFIERIGEEVAAGEIKLKISA